MNFVGSVTQERSRSLRRRIQPPWDKYSNLFGCLSRQAHEAAARAHPVMPGIMVVIVGQGQCASLPERPTAPLLELHASDVDLEPQVG